jgi:perosamine synthetase
VATAAPEVRLGRAIPVAEPVLAGREREYVLEALDSNWISSQGPFNERLEHAFADHAGVRHSLVCTNGTTALHLALASLGVGPGDEVICPALTYVATANAVRYCGAEPVFVDVNEATWTIDPDQLSAVLTPHTRGVIAVHLYGQVADLEAICAFAARHDLFVVEDAAEAHGAEHRGKRVGSIGDVGTFSLYGNKIITAGEGGVVTTDDDHLAERIALLRGQGQDPARRYWFTAVGFNYRMTNLAAAIALGQLEMIDWHLARRAEVARWYAELLDGVDGLKLATSAATGGVDWLVSALVPASARDGIAASLASRGVETRPFFPPLHTLPPYAVDGARFPVAERLAATGLNLPTSARLSRDDVEYVVRAFLLALADASHR